MGTSQIGVKKPVVGSGLENPAASTVSELPWQICGGGYAQQKSRLDDRHVCRRRRVARLRHGNHARGAEHNSYGTAVHFSCRHRRRAGWRHAQAYAVTIDSECRGPCQRGVSEWQEPGPCCHSQPHLVQPERPRPSRAIRHIMVAETRHGMTIADRAHRGERTVPVCRPTRQGAADRTNVRGWFWRTNVLYEKSYMNGSDVP